MVMQLTVTIPDEIYKRVQQLAQSSGQEVTTVASMVLGLSLSELDSRSVESLSDNEIIILADSMMDSEQNARFSALQDKQQAGTITSAERDELRILLEIYNAGQLRKTQALVEAVKRGLRPRLDL
jgi:hypothetical protein